MIISSCLSKNRFVVVALITSFLVLYSQAASLDVEAMVSIGDQSVTACDLKEDCDKTRLSPASYDAFYKKDKKGWASHGLDPNLLNINQIAVGFIPAFHEPKYPNMPQQINDKLYKPMSIVGDYISLSWWDPNLKAIDWHVPIIQALEGPPVWCIALRPVDGLDSVTWEVAHKVALKMKEVNDKGITIWLRFAYEMNGDWNAWGMQPDKFIIKWRLLAKEIRRHAPNTRMLWSPNVRFSRSITDKKGGYALYWPGEEWVDLVGFSLYHWGKLYERVNVAPTKAEVISHVYEFAKLYGPEGWGKPVVVAETAACYTYYAGTNQPVEGGASEYTIKMTWLHLLLDRYIVKTIPGLLAVIWFEVIKDENATGNTPVRTEDFRLVTGNPVVSDAVRKLFASYHSSEQSRL